MNSKIIKQLQIMFTASPQLMRDPDLLRKAINGTFGVDINISSFDNLATLTEIIDHEVLKNYFSKVWQPQTKRYKYSGLSIIDEVNNLQPKKVLDLGCGYNEFKGKINNLIGIDPYNDKADVQSRILDYNAQTNFDVVICLGSINFGTVDKIYTELEHAVSLTKQNGLLYFRANPGRQHEAPEAQWIDFFEWTSEFIINSADRLGCDLIQLNQDMGERGSRYYFILKKK